MAKPYLQMIRHELTDPDNQTLHEMCLGHATDHHISSSRHAMSLTRNETDCADFAVIKCAGRRRFHATDPLSHERNCNRWQSTPKNPSRWKLPNTATTEAPSIWSLLPDTGLSPRNE